MKMRPFIIFYILLFLIFPTPSSSDASQHRMIQTQSKALEASETINHLDHISYPNVFGLDDNRIISSIHSLSSQISIADTSDDLLYGTYLTGYSNEYSTSIVLDESSNVYITGWTWSSDFPTTGEPPSSFSPAHFVAKLDANGQLVYSVFIDPCTIATDGAGSAYDIAIDGAGNAYAVCTGSGDISVVKLNADGTDVVYAISFGGSASDIGYGIAVDSQGNAYVTGNTRSLDFPVTSGAFDTVHNGGDDVFIAKLNATGTALTYATFLGSNSDDYVRKRGIDIDQYGNVYITGHTRSSDFPTTSGAFDTTYNDGGSDAFVAKLGADGANLIYATFLGGSSSEYGGNYCAGGGITVDADGNAYVIGSTWSADFPVTPGVFDTSYNGFSDVFVAKLNATATELLYATFVGGTSNDYGNHIAVGTDGNAYLMVQTASVGFPTTPNAYDTSYNGDWDGVSARLSSDGTQLIYSTFLGGGGKDFERGQAITVDSDGYGYVTGEIGYSDILVAKLRMVKKHSISGRITDARNNPIASVNVSANGTTNNTTTNASGYYTFATPFTGTYTLTPNKTAYSFSPTSRTISVPPDATEQDFTGVPDTFSISGTVRSGTGAPISGVTVSAGSGASAVTDASGEYAISGLASGTYSLTASKVGWTFTPALLPVTVPPDTTGRDFVGELVEGPLPVIFVPGVMGSYLVDQGGLVDVEVWPGAGTIHRSLSLYPEDNPDPDIVATDVIRYALPFKAKPVYGPLLERLADEGYVEYEVNNDPARRTTTGCDYANQHARNPNLFVFAYDWRKDNDENAAALRDYMGCIQQFHPGENVKILAHSMGGVLSRRYILKYPDTHNVNALISVGTPWLGSPDGVYILETGKTDFSPLLLWRATAKYLAGSFTSVHQLLPGQIYDYLRGASALVEMGWDVDGDKQAYESYDYGNYIDVINSRYGRSIYRPGTTADAFHTYTTTQGGQDDWRNDTTGVVYHHLYGVQQALRTTVQVNMTKKAHCFAGLCTPKTYAEAIMGRGDKTVPLESLAREGRGQNYNAPQAELHLYTNEDDELVEHTGMLQNTKVLDDIVAFLDPSSYGQATGQRDSVSMSSITPVYYLRIIGGTSVVVSDLGGNSTEIISDTVAMQGQVPGVDTLTLGEDVEMVILSMGSYYTVTFETVGEPMAIELTAGTGVTATQAILYRDLLLPESVPAMLTFTPQGVNPLRYDGDQNGSYEGTIAPTVAVSGTTPLDVTPPTLTVSQSAQQHKIEVILTAEDTGSGVKEIYYSLDGAQYRSYTGPLLVDPALTSRLYAFADDNLANRSSLVVAELSSSSELVYLPMVIR